MQASRFKLRPSMRSALPQRAVAALCRPIYCILPTSLSVRDLALNSRPRSSLFIAGYAAAFSALLVLLLNASVPVSQTLMSADILLFGSFGSL